MLTLIDMFGYESERQMSSPSVNSWCGFGDAVEEGLRGGREDAVGVFVDASRDESSLAVIGAWAGEWSVEVLAKMDDVAPVRVRLVKVLRIIMSLGSSSLKKQDLSRRSENWVSLYEITASGLVPCEDQLIIRKLGAVPGR